MKFLVFSDVHGNLPALENMLEKESVDGYINLGDVVNYGPWSNECVEVVDGLSNCINIRGNHEQYFIDNFCDVKNQLVLDFFDKCIADFKHPDIISKYEKEVMFDGFRLVHTLNGKQYIFNDTEIEITKNTILGHSHQQFEKTIAGNKLINPGSVGQNRKFINVSNYAIWDLQTENFEMKQSKFNLELLVNEMKKKKYSQICIEYYTNKNKAN